MSDITREEAIEQFKYAIDLIKQDGKDYLDERDILMLKMGIEALENQTSVIAELEKIRAEIENHCGLAKEDHCKYCSYCNNLMGVREILEIIDKYKAEKEELKGE